MKDKLVTIAEFENSFEANLAKLELEANEIKTMVLGEDLVTNMYPMAVIKIQIQVMACDAEKAAEILEKLDNLSEGQGQLDE